MKDRLLELVQDKAGGKNGRFEKLVGLSNGFIRNSSGNLENSTIDLILSKFPDVNRAWFVLGIGDKYIANNIDSESNISRIEKEIEDLKDKFRLQSITIEQLEARIKEKDDLIREKEKRLEEKERTIQILLKQTNLVELQKTTVG